MELIVKQFGENGIEFQVINGEVYANATLMCKAFGKRPIDWSRLPQTERYLMALKSKCENLTLIESRHGGNESGTWIHEKLILKLAQWLDVDFEIWCDEQIATLLKTGKVEAKPMNQLEMISFMALQMNEQNQRTEKLEKKVLEIESKQTTIDTNFYTISGYANLHKLKVDTQEANRLGRIASKTSKELQYPTGYAYDSKYGQIKTYHKDILKLTFKN